MFFFQNAKLEKVGYRAILVQGIKTFSLTGVFENFSKGEQLQSFFELLPNEVVNDSLSHDKFAKKKKSWNQSIQKSCWRIHYRQTDQKKERQTKSLTKRQKFIVNSKTLTKSWTKWVRGSGDRTGVIINVFIKFSQKFGQ